jgi:hypothetical protein
VRGISPSQGRYLHTGQHKQSNRIQTSTPQLEFEPTTSMFQQTKTVHASDRAATVVRKFTFYLYQLLKYLKIMSHISRNTATWRKGYSYSFKTPWPEFESELYRPSDRRLSAKLVPTFLDRECHVVSVTGPYGRILGFTLSLLYLLIMSLCIDDTKLLFRNSMFQPLRGHHREVTYVKCSIP